MKVQSKKSKLLQAFISLLTLVAAVLFLAPLYIVVVNAFKTPMETAQSILAPSINPTFGNFEKALEVTNFFVTIKNSVIVTVLSVAFIVLSSSMAGYIICRKSHKKFYKIMDLFLMTGMMISFQMIMIPVYKMLKNLGMMNTFAGAVILMVGISVSYATFLYVGFTKTIPIELEEAAKIDGCGQYRVFWQIVFPLMKPITSTVASLHMLWMWNEFNVGLIVLQKKDMRTIPMQQFYFFGQHVSDMNAAFAAACLSLIPIVIFFLLTQKSIEGGMTAGAVKG